MTALVDTNVLVYRFDARYPEYVKKAKAINPLSVVLAHQAIVEFVAAVSRPLDGAEPLLTPEVARREAEEMLLQFDVLYPDEELVRIALRGAAAYQLSWSDAHMWAYAERFGLSQLFSEDFEHGRVYGIVEVVNPFA